MSESLKAPSRDGNTEKLAKTGKISGPKGSVASFIRPRDGVRIWVFARNGEGKDSAISRVKRHNGAVGVAHQEVVS